MWPAGHPNIAHNFDYYPFGEVEWGPSKKFLLSLAGSENMRFYYNHCFGKRPEFELYNITRDPYQLNNLSGSSAHAETEKLMKEELFSYLDERDDLRISGEEEIYNKAPYYFNKGLQSGGLQLKQWLSLSEEEKLGMIEREEKKLNENLRKLQELGWEY